jgi:hypothetical protein
MDAKSRHLPKIPDEHFDAFNEIRNAHKETWAETFERFFNYQDWVDHLFNLPKKASDGDKVNASTVTHLLPMWLENLRRNAIGDLEVPDIREIENSVAPGTHGLVIGAGPSLRSNNHLSILHDSAFYKEHQGVIISTAHSLKDCLDADVIPDYMTMIDANPIMMDFIDHEIVDGYSKEITGIFSIETDPDVLERWKGAKLFFLTIVPSMTTPNVQTVISCLFPNITEFDCLANCGGFSWNIARYIGCNPITLIGMDLAFKPDFPIKDTPYYGAFRPSYESEKEMTDACYQFHTHSFFGTNSYTDYVYNSFRETCLMAFKAYHAHQGTITQNCTEGGIIDDEAVENKWFKDFLEEFGESNS